MRIALIYLFFTFVFTLAIAQNQNNSSTNIQNNIDWKDQNVCLINLNKINLENDTLEFIPPYFYLDSNNNKTFYITCADGYGPVLFTLKYEFDLESFQDLGSFAIDKDSVYSIFLISDGIIFIPIDEADLSSFETFGKSMYAKDNNHIYYSRSGIIPEADVESFKPIFLLQNGTPPLARDKNHVYIWDEILTDTIQIKGLKEYLINTTK